MAAQVDLSRLPAPDLVPEPDYEALRAAWLASVAAKLPDFDAGGLESEPVVIVCEVGSFRELLSIQTVNDAGKQCMLAYATGPNLDSLAANSGIARRGGEGDLALRLRTAAAPLGTSTAGPEAAYRRHALAASPEAEDAGLDSPTAGAVTVTILPRRLEAEPELALGSVPPAEGEAARALLRAGPAPDLYRGSGLSGALLDGSAALAGTGLSVAAVSYVASKPAHLAVVMAGAGLRAWTAAAGSLSLYLLSAAGGAEFTVRSTSITTNTSLKWNMPPGDGRLAWLAGVSEDDRLLLLVAEAAAVDESLAPRVLTMLRDVEAALSAEEVRPMGDRVTVLAATDSPYDVAATLHVEAGPDRYAVLAAAEASLRSYADGARQVGRMVPRSGLIAALSVDSVFRVDLAAPPAGLAAIDGGVHTLDGIELTGVAA